MALPSGRGGGADARPNPVTGAAIEVSALPDAPAAPKSKAAPVAKKVAAVPPAGAAEPAGKPAEKSAEKSAAPGAKPPAAPKNPAATPDPAAENAPPEAPPAAAPVAVKSEAQLACEKRKGIWSKTPSGSHACVTYTKDSGKKCTRATQCDSLCLARSNTCAPFKPLFGCNDILDDSGRRMSQCLD